MLVRAMFRMIVGGALVAAFATAYAADWPQWRGPEQNAISKETGLLKSWPAAGPKVAWEYPLGEGFSAVTVAAGRVYALGQDKKTSSSFIAALDEKTGKQIWRKDIGPYYVAAKRRGPCSSPTVDGDLVYAQAGSGELTCFKADSGDVVWTKNVFKEVGTVISNKLMMWGMTASPVIFGEMLIVAPGCDPKAEAKNSSVLALNKKTGEIIWKSFNDEMAYSTPAKIALPDGDGIVIFSKNNIAALSLKDGKVAWSIPWTNAKSINIATPIIDGNLLFIGTLATGVVAYDLTQPVKNTPVWASKDISPHPTTPLLLDGCLYGGSKNGTVCIDSKTGKTLWSAADIPGGQMIYADGLFYIFDSKGGLTLARLSREKGEKISSFAPFSGVERFTVPVVANGHLYVRDDAKLLCLDVKAE